MGELEGKVAFVTGAGGYIGNAVAVTLAKEGAKVAVCDIREECMQKTVDEIRANGGIAEAIGADVTDSASVDRAIEETVAKFGRLDISVHVAGGSARVAGPDVERKVLAEMEDYVIDAVLKINLYGAIYVSRAAARQMIKQGDGGRIINFASVVGVNGLRKSAEYAASKGGVIAMTKALAKEVGKYHITANTVAPGVVKRPDQASFNSPSSFNTNFLNERCTAQDVADLVEFIASPRAHFITGQNCIVDGGRSLAMRGSELD